MNLWLGPSPEELYENSVRTAFHVANHDYVSGICARSIHFSPRPTRTRNLWKILHMPGNNSYSKRFDGGAQWLLAMQENQQQHEHPMCNASTRNALKRLGNQQIDICRLANRTRSEQNIFWSAFHISRPWQAPNVSTKSVEAKFQCRLWCIQHIWNIQNWQMYIFSAISNYRYAHIRAAHSSLV